MRLGRVTLLRYRSVSFLDFEVGPFTVLFGKNNAGKTNILEAIYGVLAPTEMPGHESGHTAARGLRGAHDLWRPSGAVVAQLDPGRPFDDEVLALDLGGEGHIVTESGAVLELQRLPAEQVSFVGHETPGLSFFDPHSYFDHLSDSGDVFVAEESFQSVLVYGPRPRPMFVDWGFEDIDERVTAAMVEMLSGGPPARPRMKGKRPVKGGAGGLSPARHGSSPPIPLHPAPIKSDLRSTWSSGCSLPWRQVSFRISSTAPFQHSSQFRHGGGCRRRWRFASKSGARSPPHQWYMTSAVGLPAGSRQRSRSRST